MKKIRSNTRNSEMAEVCNRISTSYVEVGPQDDAGLKGLFSEIDPKIHQLTIATEQMMAESDLEEKDHIRDADFKALYYLVQGATYNPDPTVRSAAQKVFKYISKYGLETTKESYDTQSNLTESLLIDLDTSEVKGYTTQVSGCAEQITILKASNNAFRTSRNKYQDEVSKDKEKISATAIRNELISLINDKLITYLKGVMVMNPEKYGSLVARIEETITQNNEVAKKRLSKRNED